MKPYQYKIQKAVISFVILFCLLLENSAAQSSRLLNEKLFIQYGGKWYQQEEKKRYEVNNSVITIKWKLEVSDKQKESLYSAKSVEILRSNSLGYIDIKITPTDDVIQITEDLINSDLFESAEVNTYGEWTKIPNDTYFSSQWNLNQSNDADIDAPEAWDISSGKSPVIIGVLDSGTDWMHNDLDGNIWINSQEDSWDNPADPSTGNGLDDDGNGFVDDWKGWDFHNNNNDSRGSYPHGTHVAGIAGAETNNGIGIAGVTGGWYPNKGAKLLIVGVGDYGPDGSILDDAILYAAMMGAKIITMSLSVGQTSAIESALSTAYNTYGCFINCASGNDGLPYVSYPARNTNVVAVGATNSSDIRPSWSNYGSELDVVAPGVNIYSTLLNNTYGIMSGKH